MISGAVRENVAWPLEFLGFVRRVARERAAAGLARVRIAEAAWSRRPGELSGGEQQRVAIARALVAGPGLLVADEPTGNLDSESGTHVLALLGQLNAEAGLTVLLVTHSPVAAAFSHRTVELRDGRVVRDVRRRAATSLAAGRAPAWR